MGPIGTEKYDKEYKEKYDKYEQTDLGKEINDCRWDLVEAHLFNISKPYILDWGCGNGSFIRSAPEGWNVKGYDINPYSGYSDGLDFIKEPWSAITMWDVLEHMVDPYEFCKHAITSYIFVTVPDIAGVEGKIEDWRHYRPDEHQHYFSVSSLSRMLSRAGFHLIDIDRREAFLRDKSAPYNLVTMVGKR